MSFKQRKTKQIITLEMLREAKACEDQIELFKHTFGTSVKLTQKALKQAVNIRFSVEWAFRKLKLTGHFTDKFKTKLWYRNGKLHRKNGPAVEQVNGNNKYWYLNGLLHREDDEPAIEYANGDKSWYKNGELHRDNGPAVEWPSGYKEWYTDGEFVK